MSTEVHAQIDSERVRELIEREARRLEEATPESKRMFERAHEVMPLGVPSSYHARDPWPIYLERGDGPRVWDVDGRELWDFHNGFGSMVMGHAHPAIVEAIPPAFGHALPPAVEEAAGESSGASRRIALATLTLLAVTGLVMAATHVLALNDLGTTPYGLTLVAKVAIALVAHDDPEVDGSAR